MTQQTMNELETFRRHFDEEYQITRRLLHAYPADKASMKPHPKLKSAQDMAWMLTLNQMVFVPLFDMDTLSGSNLPKKPETWNEILAAFEKGHQDTNARLARVTDEEWAGQIKMPVAPKQMGSRTRNEAVWYFLHDTIHHRGQFSVYLRLADAKVPSIYGPSADEPWN